MSEFFSQPNKRKAEKAPTFFGSQEPTQSNSEPVFISTPKQWNTNVSMHFSLSFTWQQQLSCYHDNGLQSETLYKSSPCKPKPYGNCQSFRPYTTRLSFHNNDSMSAAHLQIIEHVKAKSAHWHCGIFMPSAKTDYCTWARCCVKLTKTGFCIGKFTKSHCLLQAWLVHYIISVLFTFSSHCCGNIYFFLIHNRKWFWKVWRCAWVSRSLQLPQGVRIEGTKVLQKPPHNSGWATWKRTDRKTIWLLKNMYSDSFSCVCYMHNYICPKTCRIFNPYKD